MLKSAGLLLFAGVVVGCSRSDESFLPTAPSVSVPVQSTSVTPLPGMQLRGFVLDTAFRPLAGARIEVVSGPSAGAAALADAAGEFSLTGAFAEDTQFRATMNGHEERTQTWNCSVASCPGPTGARPWLGFYLSVLAPSVNLAGSYTLTFTADAACTDLPANVRARSYPVVVTAQSAPDRWTTPGFELEVTNTAVVGNMTGFPIGVAGNRVSFWLHGGHDPVIVEDLGSNTYLAFSGTGNTVIESNGTSAIAAPFEGWIEHTVLRSPLIGPWYFPLPAAAAKATCESLNHSLTLTRFR